MSLEPRKDLVADTEMGDISTQVGTKSVHMDVSTREKKEKVSLSEMDKEG